jgi:hypothetical protein
MGSIGTDISMRLASQTLERSGLTTVTWLSQMKYITYNTYKCTHTYTNAGRMYKCGQVWLNDCDVAYPKSAKRVSWFVDQNIGPS